MKNMQNAKNFAAKMAALPVVVVCAAAWALSLPALAAERTICLESEQVAERGRHGQSRPPFPQG